MDEKEKTKDEMIYYLISKCSDFQKDYLNEVSQDIIGLLYLGFQTPLKRSIKK